MKVDDLPHQVLVAGELALVVVPGRAMQCLRCHVTGHVRRDRRVPRCSKCRHYGHADADCVRTYASATGIPRADEHDELKDVVEAEETAMGTEETRKQAGLSSGDALKRGPPADRQPQADTTGPTCTQPVGQGSPAVTEGDAGEGDLPTPQGVASEVDGSTGTTGKASKGGDFKSLKDLQAEKSGVQAPISLAGASKRPHPPTSNDFPEETLAGVEEPSEKTPQVRRPTLRPRPTIPSDIAAATSSKLGKFKPRRRTLAVVMEPSSQVLDARGGPNAAGLFPYRQNGTCLSVNCRYH
ncbi:hypothetical protein HPB51_003239 [Rhipicephalus microplus]|uniref:CCHC-type domain-containing protein n=1 Tax=Rhipicephalus microplus TaxID=6941 RepID=A0A9J6EQJ7_RHIMP|nr:hypothetical protein HPB51_003239 [Rhipicephalus microplus]